MLAELQKEKISAVKAETIEERKYFLIVCEGIRTEPLYFDFLRKLLPKHLLETIQIIGQGVNTVSVVRKSIEERDKRLLDEINPKYDEVWAVFDKDEFPDKHFNQAIQLAASNGIHCGYTNQAFELWYVLHFQFLNTALNRNEYIKILSKILRINYTKSNNDLPALIFQKGNTEQAIKFAYKLEKIHKGNTPAKSIPSTKVHLLVERLLQYAKHPSSSKSQK